MKVNESYNDYISSMTESQIKEYIHTVGKAANQRLRELEKRGMENASAAYRYIKKLARDAEKTGDYTMSKTGAGQMKFNLRVRGRSLDELRHIAATIENFMEAKSSTTAGVKDIYKEAYKTFEKKYGKEGINFNEFAEAMSMTLFRHFEEIYGSAVAIKIYSQAHAGGLSDADIEEALRAAGFTESTTEDNAPAVITIENKIDEFIANRKDFENNDNGLFDEDDEL